MTLRAAIVGPGRMGRAIEEILRERGHQVLCRIGRGEDLSQASEADVTFEFTEPAAAPETVPGLLRLGVPTVCGTTGWDPRPAIQLARELQVPLLVAPNFSLGVALLRVLVAEAGRRLAQFPEFEAGIVERHHRAKRDVPSGTARLLAQILAQTRGGPEPPIVALRQGGQPGEHRILFEAADEEVELLHRARSPRIFALGAVRAAEWLVAERPSGPVTFDDFLERSLP